MQNSAILLLFNAECDSWFLKESSNQADLEQTQNGIDFDEKIMILYGFDER